MESQISLISWSAMSLVPSRRDGQGPAAAEHSAGSAHHTTQAHAHSTASRATMKYFVEMGNELREFRSEAECRGVIALNEKLNKSEKALRHTLNAKLNASEMMLRGRIGDQKVDDLIEQFRAAATPALFDALYAKRDPYRWLARYWLPKQSPTNH